MTLPVVPVRLQDAFWFQEGPGVRNWQFTDNGIKLLNVANITKEGTLKLSKTSRHLSVEEVEQRYKHFLADEGDLVIASSGISLDEDELLRTRGAFVEAEHLPLCMNTSTIRFKAKPGVSDLSFFKHWLDSHEFRSQISREVTGIAQKNFGPSHLNRLTISLPPLPEQRRIAAILDKADALRAKRRLAIAKLDQLLQSVFLEMFDDPVTNPKGWPTKLLSDLCDKQDRVNYGVVQPGDDHPEGKPFIRVGDMEGGLLSTAKLKHIAPEIEAAYSRSRLKGNELLVSCVGSIGVVAEVPPEAIGFNIARAITRVPLATPEYRPFVRELLRTAAVQRYFEEKTRTVSQPTLNVEFVKDTPVIQPRPDLIEKFCALSNKFTSLRGSVLIAEGGMMRTFSSIQQTAFSSSI